VLSIASSGRVEKQRKNAITSMGEEFLTPERVAGVDEKL